MKKAWYVAQRAVVALFVVLPFGVRVRDATAQGGPTPTPSPPAPPLAPTPAAAALQPETDFCHSKNCASLEACGLLTNADVKAYACLSWKASRTCREALTKSGKPLDEEDNATIRRFYYERSPSLDCWVPHPLQTGWIGAAILVGKGDGPYVRHALQVLPTISIGTPVAFFNGENAAEHALRGIGTVGGATVRYSPVGFWASVHGFIGTSTVSAEKLDPAVYKNPALLLYGVGLDVLGGALGISLMAAGLKPDGLNSRQESTACYLQFSVDLTALGLTAAGLTK